MNNNTAFLTTIFPTKETYLRDFFQSLERQTYAKFDTLVVNDGYAELDSVKKQYARLNIIELPCDDTPAKNRELGINFAITQGYDNLIFGDSDDYFSDNRVERSLELLKNCDIVVNDLCLFNESGVISRNYISNRIPNNYRVTIDFIKNKNIFGLSNTAIHLSGIHKVDFDKELVAVDWFFYSNLLLDKKIAVFTNEAQTFYRQHGKSTVGIGKLNAVNFELTLKVKEKHYRLLKDKCEEYRQMHGSVKDLQKKISTFSILDQSLPENPLWWESQNYERAG